MLYSNLLLQAFVVSTTLVAALPTKIITEGDILDKKPPTPSSNDDFLRQQHYRTALYRAFHYWPKTIDGKPEGIDRFIEHESPPKRRDGMQGHDMAPRMMIKNPLLSPDVSADLEPPARDPSVLDKYLVNGRLDFSKPLSEEDRAALRKEIDSQPRLGDKPIWGSAGGLGRQGGVAGAVEE